MVDLFIELLVDLSLAAERAALLLRAAGRRIFELLIAAGLAVGIFALGAGLADWTRIPVSAYLTQGLPTLIALFAGVPFAVWGYRVQQDATAAENAAAAQARRVNVLSLIRDELDQAASALGDRRRRQPRPPFLVPFLNLGAWRAAADGGELSAVADPDLLATAVDAYHQLEMTHTLERTLFETDAHRFNGTATPLGQTYQARLSLLIEQDGRSEAAVQKALLAISEVVPRPRRRLRRFLRPPRACRDQRLSRVDSASRARKPSERS